MNREHFALSDSSLGVLVSEGGETRCTERVEMYLDTPARDLARQDIWVRHCVYIEDNKETKKVEWTWKKKVSPGHYEKHRGFSNVMKALEELLGKNVSAFNPCSYCPCAVAVLRVRRYTFSAITRFKWWVDVCYFKKDDPLYVVGTKEVVEPVVEWPVPSKIVAYLTKYSSLEGEHQAPTSMFVKDDPFGGGPFLPVFSAESDSSSSEEEEEEYGDCKNAFE